MSRISHALGSALANAIGIATVIACAAPAWARTAAYVGPHGGVAAVHTPGPYIRPVPGPWRGPCCYAPYRGAGALAAGVAAGAVVGAAAAASHPALYPYAYGYPVAVVPRPYVYPAPVGVASPPVVVYPARPWP